MGRWRYRAISDEERGSRTQHAVDYDPDSASDTDSDTSKTRPIPRSERLQWVEAEERPADRWFALLFMGFLLSLLFNAFLLFNGPTKCIGKGGAGVGKGVGGGQFRFRDSEGSNWSCVEVGQISGRELANNDGRVVLRE